MSTETVSRADVTKTNEYWVKLDRAYRIQSRASRPIVLAKGDGVDVWDVEGNKYLDFESGQMGMIIGHSHPAVLEKLKEQSGLLMHTSIRVLNVPRILLAQKLAEITAAPLTQSYFACTGSEANEGALRLAKKYSGRFEVVAVLGGYHGRTLGSTSYTTGFKKARAGYGPEVWGAAFIPAPSCYRCPFNETPPCRLSCLDYAEEVIDRTTSGQPAAVLVELIQGVGGLSVPPVEWVQRLRRMCDEREMLFIDDEALVGVGRTGKWFAYEHFGIVPDILTTSKGLGQGVPLSAVITSEKIAAEAVRKGHDQAATHMGDPFQCAVGLANLEVIEREHLLERTIKAGALLKEGLLVLQERYEIVGDVRGLGLFLGMEIVESRNTKKPAPQRSAKLVAECEDKGLLMGGGRMGVNVIRLCPPLVITDEQVATALGIIEEALRRA